LVEAVMLLVPFILLVFLLLEAFRREVFQVVLTHITCTEVRARALGERKEEIDLETQRFLTSALGSALGHDIKENSHKEFQRVTEPAELRWLQVGNRPGGLSEIWLRYEQFIGFDSKEKRKHHQEITKRCLFPFS